MASNGFNITPKIRLDGVSEFKKQINLVNTYVKNMSSEIKANTSSLSGNAESYKLIVKNAKNLEEIYEAQVTKLNLLNEKYETSVRDTGEFSTQSMKLKTQINNQTVAVEKAKDSLDEYIKSDEYLVANFQDSRVAISRAKDNLKELTSEYKKSRNETGKYSEKTLELKKKVDEAKQSLKLAKDNAKAAGDEIKEAGEKSEESSEGFTVLKGALANLVSDGISKAISAIKDFGIEVVNVGKTFDSSMSNVQAISGATNDDFEKLSQKAKELGAATKFTAAEVADGFSYMAMAGWKTEDMLNGIEGILSLAAASGSDLATTSDIVTDALTGLGYTAKDSGRLADVMAAASSNANTNVELMGETFKYVAPVAGALGMSMEDVAAAIGLMANAGIKGSQAGTALRSILSRLAAPPRTAADAMNQLNFSFTTSGGKVKSLRKIMEELRKSFGKLDKAQQAAIAKDLAGQEAMSGLLSIVNAAPADFNKLITAIDNSAGSANNMSNIMLNNLGGDLTKLSSQFEGVQLTIYDKLEPALRDFVGTVSDILSDIDWDEVGKEASKAMDKALEGFEWVMENKKTIVNAIKVIIGTFAVKKITSWTESMSKTLKISELLGGAWGILTGKTKLLTSATKIFGTVLKTNPIGVVLTAATALYGVYKLLSDKTRELTEEEKAHQEQVEKMTQSVSDNAEEWSRLEEQRKENLNLGKTEIEGYQRLWDELKNLTNANGKVKEGYEKRAKFIVTTLNEALGTEIKMNGNLITNYKKLGESIDKVIEKKKYELIISSQEDQYKEALKNVNDEIAARSKLWDETESKRVEALKLQKEYNEKEWDGMGGKTAYGKALDEFKKLRASYNEATDNVNNYLYTIAQYESNTVALAEERYKDISTINYKTAKSYNNANDAQKVLLEERVKTEESKLEIIKRLYKNSGDKMYEIQIKNQEKTLEAAKKDLKNYKDTYESTSSEVIGIVKNSQSSLINETIFNGFKLYLAGQNNGKSYVSGINSIHPQFVQAGKNITMGIGEGIDDDKTKESIFTKIAKIARKILDAFKKIFKIKSPSRETKEMGEFLVQGLSLGIKEETKPLLSQINGFGKSVMKNLQYQLGNDIEMGKVKTELDTRVNVSRPTNVNSTNNDSYNSFENGNKPIINQYMSINSPKQLNPTETAREIEKISRQLAYDL